MAPGESSWLCAPGTGRGMPVEATGELGSYLPWTFGHSGECLCFDGVGQPFCPPELHTHPPQPMQI